MTADDTRAITRQRQQVVPPPISVPRIEPQVASASGGTAGTGVQSVRSVPPREPANGRSGVALAGAALLGVLAAVGIVLAFLAIRARHASTNAHSALPPAAPVTVASAPNTAAAEPAAAPETASRTPSDPSGAPSTDDDLVPPILGAGQPSATPSSTIAVAHPHPPKPTTKPTATTAPGTTAAPAKTGKKRIDDGF